MRDSVVAQEYNGLLTILTSPFSPKAKKGLKGHGLGSFRVHRPLTYVHMPTVMPPQPQGPRLVYAHSIREAWYLITKSHKEVLVDRAWLTLCFFPPPQGFFHLFTKAIKKGCTFGSSWAPSETADQTLPRDSQHVCCDCRVLVLCSYLAVTVPALINLRVAMRITFTKGLYKLWVVKINATERLWWLD
jgi:hypothetical protein